MREKHVINVAGLMMSGKDDGIESELRDNVEMRSIRTIAPTSAKLVLMESPRDAILRCTEMVRDEIAKIQLADKDPEVVMIGRSYGASMALHAAIATNFENISRVVLLEGPLHPDVEVTVPSSPLLKVMHASRKHYKERAALAEIFTEHVEINGTNGIVIVQGTEPDEIVPNEAQILPGDFEEIEVYGPEYDFENHFSDQTRGKIFKLPKGMGGHNRGKAKLFSDPYRNHLFWSEEKMLTVRRIIEAAGS